MQFSDTSKPFGFLDRTVCPPPLFARHWRTSHEMATWLSRITWNVTLTTNSEKIFRFVKTENACADLALFNWSIVVDWTRQWFLIATLTLLAILAAQRSPSSRTKFCGCRIEKIHTRMIFVVSSCVKRWFIVLTVTPHSSSSSPALAPLQLQCDMFFLLEPPLPTWSGQKQWQKTALLNAQFAVGVKTRQISF